MKLSEALTDLQPRASLRPGHQQIDSSGRAGTAENTVQHTFQRPLKTCRCLWPAFGLPLPSQLRLLRSSPASVCACWAHHITKVIIMRGKPFNATIRLHDATGRLLSSQLRLLRSRASGSHLTKAFITRGHANSISKASTRLLVLLALCLQPLSILRGPETN